MSSVETLIPDILRVLSKGDHVPNEENLKSFAGNCANEVRKSLSRDPSEFQKLRISNIGLPDRKLWFSINYPVEKVPSEELLDGEDYFKFLFGHIIEQLVVLLAKEAGHTITNEQKEVVVEGVPGHIDCEVDDEAVVDVKSCSPYSFGKFKSGEVLRGDPKSDPFGYLHQINGYRFGREQESNKERKAAFLCVDKSSGRMHLSILDPVMDYRSPSKRIGEIKKFINEPTPPKEKCYEDEPMGKSGNRVLSRNCEWCMFKQECWKDCNNGEGLKVYDYASGKKYFTHVEKEPKVEQG